MNTCSKQGQITIYDLLDLYKELQIRMSATDVLLLKEGIQETLKPFI